MAELITESVFTWGGTPLKIGVGAADELPFDLAQLGVQRVLIVTDRGVMETGIPERVRTSLDETGLKAEIFDGVHVEPTDESLRQAAEFAQASDPDGFVAIGGGSAIDTAKAANLLTCYPGDVMDYVNKPIGAGKAPAGPLKPLVAVPTTAGTGSESTPVCVLDILGLRAKSGISHPRLRPTLAVVDPLRPDAGHRRAIGRRGLRVHRRRHPSLVEGTLKQQRLLTIAPREAGAEELAEIFRRSMENW